MTDPHPNVHPSRDRPTRQTGGRGPRRAPRRTARITALLAATALLGPAVVSPVAALAATDSADRRIDDWWAGPTDIAPPHLEAGVEGPVPLEGRPVLIRGVTEAGIHVRVTLANGPTRHTRAGADGTFSVQVAASDTTVTVEVLSPAGRTASTTFDLVVAPKRVLLDAHRAAHVSFCGWAAGSIRQGILDMIADGRINAVQLDIKDESGHVGHHTQVALAQQAGATAADCVIDLEAAVAELHALGVPVIGRIVAFADPVLARWAWDNDRRDMAIQTSDGEMFTGHYSGFANFAHPDVVAYNIDIAVEAARLGVDHILWDYIRRPDGRVSSMHFEGLEGTPEDGIVAFTRAAEKRLAPLGVLHGASVYGIAATRPTEIGQDIPRMAQHLDYVAPMIYPSHWGPGELGLSNPVREPYEVVVRSLATFEEAVAGTQTRIIPWLEDSTHRAWDRPFQVAEQIRGTYDSGVEEWLLWDPSVRYSPDAIEPR
ncbi:MAG: putative glycoside hydrolase [Nitriliruptoraceae bacterium]